VRTPRQFRPSKEAARCLLAAAVLMFGCGGGDDQDASAPPQGAEEPTQGATFKAGDVAFTFEYPEGFQQVEEPEEGVLASVTPAPGDVNNGLKIRSAAEQELPFSSYAGQIRAQFQDQLATKVSRREEKRGAIDLGILEWAKPYTKSDAGEKKTVRLHSTNYFFAGGGKTWHLECLSSEDHRSEVDQACAQAIGSIEFTEGP